MRKLLATMTCATALTVVPFSAHTFSDSGAYIAGGLGASFVDLQAAEDDIRDIAREGNSTINSLESDDGSPALSLGVGYRFTRYVSAELNYYNLGEFEVAGEVTTSGGSRLTRTDKISFDGFGARIIGHIPLHRRWTIDIAAGLAQIDAEREKDPFTLPDSTERSSETVPTIGLGTQFHVNRYWSVRGMFTHFNEAGDSSTSEGDVNMITVGAAFRF